jgi:hypothetical protein
MYKLFENFRRNLQERPGDKIIQTEAVVVMSKKHDMNVVDFLSRIRAIDGVTIVKALETVEKQLHNTTRMSIKIDGEYLPENSIDAIKEQVRIQALRIPGVIRFTYIKPLQSTTNE